MKASSLFAIFVLSFISCNYERKTHIPTDLEIRIWEEDFGQLQMMAGTLTREVDGNGYKVRFSLSDSEKLKIYHSLVSSGILDLEEDYYPKPNCDGMHQLFYLMTVVDGDFVRNIHLSNCDYGLIEELQTKRYLNVIGSILNIAQKKPEVANIPGSEVIRF